MDVKEQTKKAYELFGSGDMETFFNDMIDDSIAYALNTFTEAIDFSFMLYSKVSPDGKK